MSRSAREVTAKFATTEVPNDVVLHDGKRVHLSERHVFEGGGVINDVRPKPLEHIAHAVFIGYRTEDRHQMNRSNVCRQVAVNVVQILLGGIEQNQCAWAQRMNGARQSRTDRSTCSGDQDGLRVMDWRKFREVSRRWLMRKESIPANVLQVEAHRGSFDIIRSAGWPRVFSSNVQARKAHLAST